MKDNIKNYLGWALVLLTLVLVFVSISYVSAYKRSIPAMNTFGVSGEGKTVIVPDVAEFNFGVITEGGVEVTKLQADNTAKVNKAIGYLKVKKIASKDIQTIGYNVSPRYRNKFCEAQEIDSYGPVAASRVPCPPEKSVEIVGYTVTQTVSVKIRDFKIVGEVLTGVVESGANTVSQLNFTIDDPEAARADAREKAIKLAKDKARAIAGAAGFNIGRLVSIDEGGYYPSPMYFSKGAAMGGEMEVAVAPTIEPGSQEVVVTVNLRYEID